MIIDIEILADRWLEEQEVLKNLDWPTPQPTTQTYNLPF